jgi:ketosteroid isomerase-like protein
MTSTRETSTQETSTRESGMRGTSDTGTAEDERAIRGLIAEKVAAMRSGDAARVTAQYTADLVQFSLAPPLQQAGPDEEGLRSWFAGFGGTVGYEVRDLRVTVGGDVAFCTSLTCLSATPEAGGTDRFTLWFRSTVGLRRIDGWWRITHEHQSTPFYMDGSFAAALDLTP